MIVLKWEARFTILHEWWPRWLRRISNGIHDVEKCTVQHTAQIYPYTQGLLKNDTKCKGNRIMAHSTARPWDSEFIKSFHHYQISNFQIQQSQSVLLTLFHSTCRWSERQFLDPVGVSLSKDSNWRLRKRWNNFPVCRYSFYCAMKCWVK